MSIDSHFRRLSMMDAGTEFGLPDQSNAVDQEAQQVYLGEYSEIPFSGSDTFPAGYGRAVSFASDNTLVVGSGSHIRLIALFSLVNVPTEAIDAGALSALNGGGDVVITSDIDGNNRLAIHINSFVTNASAPSRECEIWFDTESLSTSGDETYYFWYKKSGRVQPSVSDTFGVNDNWKDYDRVTLDGVFEATGKGSITNSSTTSTAGPFEGDVRTKTNSASVFIESALSGSIVYPYSMQCWGQTATSSDTRMIGIADNSVANQQANLGTDHDAGNGMELNTFTSVSEDKIGMTAGQSLNTWFRYSGVFANSTSRIAYLDDGTDTVSGSTDLTATNIDTLRMGSSADSTPFGGGVTKFGYGYLRLDEISSDWVATEFNNQNDPGAFWTTGTPFTPGAAAGIPPQLMLTGVG